MTNRIESLSLNGVLESPVAKGKKKGKKVPSHYKPLVTKQPRLALILTIVMGVGIPLLSLSLSTIAGKLALTGHEYLAASALVLTSSVLAVSLSHLAWSVKDITHSSTWQSWALAITIDLAVVLSESVHVFAPDADVEMLATTVMVAVTLASMGCNVWAFLVSKGPV
jgi:hypothetical protein